MDTTKPLPSVLTVVSGITPDDNQNAFSFAFYKAAPRFRTLHAEYAEQ